MMVLVMLMMVLMVMVMKMPQKRLCSFFINMGVDELKIIGTFGFFSLHWKPGGAILKRRKYYLALKSLCHLCVLPLISYPGTMALWHRTLCKNWLICLCLFCRCGLLLLRDFCWGNLLTHPPTHLAH